MKKTVSRHLKHSKEQGNKALCPMVLEVKYTHNEPLSIIYIKKESNDFEIVKKKKP